MCPCRRLGAAVLLLTALVVAGCGSAGPTPPAAPEPATSTTTSGGGAGTTAGAAPTTVAGSTGGSSGATGCDPSPPGWGTGPRQLDASSLAPVYGVRAGQHRCYDRVVFDVNGPEQVGYDVRYVDVVREDGSGNPVPVAGGAAIQVVLRAPALGSDSQGHQPGKVLAAPRQDFYTAAQLAGWGALRQVRYAGSFEGQTTVAVGVRARTPFRVSTLLDSRDQIRRVVLDVAH